MDREALASLLGEAVPEQLWRRIPLKVRRILEELCQQLRAQARDLAELRRQLGRLKEENEDLREQLNSNSSNSSKPPSSDRGKNPRRQGRKPGKKGSGRRRGGQPGHPEHPRKLFPSEECEKQEECEAECCGHCGSRDLQKAEEPPERHQVWEIPEPRVTVVEYLLAWSRCMDCGGLTQACLPAGVPVEGYGPRLTALAGVLGGAYRISYRMTQDLLKDLFAVEISLGEIRKLRDRVSRAVSSAVEEAKAYVQTSGLVYADETSHPQGNADGKNPEKRMGWLWVIASPLVAYFEIALSRSKATAQQLLGEVFSGILSSDRYAAYNWIPVYLRQVCWSHLERTFEQIASRNGKSGKLGRQLLELRKKLFDEWYRVRDGTIAFSTFRTYASRIRVAMRALLSEGASYRPRKGEKSGRAKTARTCAKLLELEPAMWLFTRREGVEPTNNFAERLLRHGVMWRRTSFGTQSEWGSIFVSRMLTVVESLRLQGRPVLEYVTAACESVRKGQAPPSLLPSSQPEP